MSWIFICFCENKPVSKKNIIDSISTLNHIHMGLIKALIVTCILYAILYVLQKNVLHTLSTELQIKCLTWIPLILIFLYLLL